MQMRSLVNLKADVTTILVAYNKINPSRDVNKGQWNHFCKHFSLSGGSLWKGEAGRQISQNLQAVVDSQDNQSPESFLKAIFDIAHAAEKKSSMGSHLAEKIIEFVAKEIKVSRWIDRERLVRCKGYPGSIAIGIVENNDAYYHRIGMIVGGLAAKASASSLQP